MNDRILRRAWHNHQQAWEQRKAELQANADEVDQTHDSSTQQADAENSNVLLERFRVELARVPDKQLRKEAQRLTKDPITGKAQVTGRYKADLVESFAQWKVRHHLETLAAQREVQRGEQQQRGYQGVHSSLARAYAHKILQQMGIGHTSLRQFLSARKARREAANQEDEGNEGVECDGGMDAMDEEMSEVEELIGEHRLEDEGEEEFMRRMEAEDARAVAQGPDFVES